MRLLHPEDPLACNACLIQDALKVLAEIEGPTDPLRIMLEELHFDPESITDAMLALQALEGFVDDHDENIRGFSRDFNYITAVLEELETRAVEEEGKTRGFSFSFGEQPPPQEMEG
jgi:hypothetical protein